MRDDGFNPHGSGPVPIGPHDAVELVDFAEAQLQRAERAIMAVKKFGLRDDLLVTAQPSTGEAS